MEHAEFLRRTELMLGAAALDALSGIRVAVFGLGGVGSWCAESLVRTGVRRLMLVDRDTVCATNVNRQAMATSKTIGQAKAEALAERLREINPEVELDVRPRTYDAASAHAFDLGRHDYVVDAIDSLEDKALLIRNALSEPGVTLFASMGAARKMDPFQIRKSEFSKVEGDGLARALRRRFRATGGIPERPFVCVWSPERRENLGCRPDPPETRANGTVAHMTAIFGFALAGLVVADVEARLARKAAESAAPENG